MPRTSKRLDRISDQLKQELAVLIQGELRDPRLGMVSVMDVRVSRDLAHAEVFVTTMGAEPAEAVTIMNKAAGFLRSLLAKNLNLRVTPRLKFIWDESIERGRHLSALIDEAVAQDAQHDSGEEELLPDESPGHENPPEGATENRSTEISEKDPTNFPAEDDTST